MTEIPEHLLKRVAARRAAMDEAAERASIFEPGLPIAPFDPGKEFSPPSQPKQETQIPRPSPLERLGGRILGALPDRKPRPYGPPIGPLVALVVGVVLIIGVGVMLFAHGASKDPTPTTVEERNCVETYRSDQVVVKVCS